MRLLIDTNVVLDVLLKRDPFFETSTKVLKLSGQNDMQEYISASAITDIYYIANRMIKDKKLVRELLKNLLQVLSVAAVSEEEIANALELEWSDFEDSVQYSVALFNTMDGLVTRNPENYSESKLPVWTPEEIVKFNFDN